MSAEHRKFIPLQGLSWYTVYKAYLQKNDLKSHAAGNTGKRMDKEVKHGFF